MSRHLLIMKCFTDDNSRHHHENGEGDVGIVFHVSDKSSNYLHPSSSPAMKTTRSSSIDDDKPKTAVEAILPWRRNSSFGYIDPDKYNNDIDKSGNGSSFKGALPEDDDEQAVLKQQEFPPWIGNKEYLPNSYASPTNTLLQALDRDRNKESQNRIPPVFEIFAGTTPSQSGNSSNNEEDAAYNGSKVQQNKPPKQSSSPPNSRNSPRSQNKESNITSDSHRTRRRGSSSAEEMDMKDMRKRRGSKTSKAVSTPETTVTSSVNNKGQLSPRVSPSNLSSSPTISYVFPARPSSRQEAVTAINPAFLPDEDDSHHPVTKL